MSRRHVRAAALAAAAVLSATGLATGLTAAQAQPAGEVGVQDVGVPNGDVIANLWSWNWPSVAAECVDHLDPAGYGAVWVAPPSESLKHPDGAWWDVYQPYSYGLTGRFGTEAEFAAMVDACHGAGIKVYTDAVINHTAAQTGIGYDGTQISDKYDPPMYDRGDYHVDECDREIENWGDLWEVQNCELLGLPDLDTGDAAVRSELAGYLNAQIALGVDGFRIDAAKHMPAGDLDAIVDQLWDTTTGERPYVFQEVYPGEPPSPSDYFGVGDVLDFTVGDKLKSAFNGDIASLASFGDGLLPAENSVSFVTNHDTERNGSHLTYRDGATAVLANVFQLAWRNSAPTIYAGFTYTDPDGAPPNSDGFVTDTNCGDGWYCLNREQAVVGMVEWHNAVGDAAVRDWQSPTSNVIGFGRGTTGFVAINNRDNGHTGSFAVNLPDGTYCNVITACASTVTVSSGSANISVPAKSAVAFYTGDSAPPQDDVRAAYTIQAETHWGQNVYVVGNVPELGSWDPSRAVPLTTGPSTYPRWHGSGSLPPDTSIEYKFVIREDGRPVIWEVGANRTLRTPSSGDITVDGGWFRR